MTFAEAANTITARILAMDNSHENVYQSIPLEFRTPNCAQLQTLLADALSSQPKLKAKNRIDQKPNDLRLAWLLALRTDGKMTNDTKVRRLAVKNRSTSPAPLAEVESTSTLTPTPPIISDDEEPPIADISKGSDIEIIQVHHASVKQVIHIIMLKQ